MQTTSLPYSSLPVERIGQHPAQQLPAAIRIGTVHLAVADLSRSLAFYQDVLGFQLLRRVPAADGQAAGAELGVAGSGQVLVALYEQPGARPVPRRGRLGIYHFAVLLPTRADLGRFLRHAQAQGVHVGSSDHLYSEATYLTDPDGFTVEVYRDRPRSEWRVTDEGEIQSALDPLDVPGVLQAAGNTPWQGLPAGTTMGHLHFYTGSLPEAAAFYHQALGLDIVTWSLPGALFVSAGGYHHHLGLNVWAAGSPAATDEDARLLHWELWLPDAGSRDAAAQRLQQAGYPAASTPEGPMVTDPWGIRLLLRAEA
ncbi:VOC family protein [Hymenobacter sp. BT770]|uniref:VOC family protein n=1 Tax=Hymenobacter sp. BT770 TaxID=2886942 RepID=UPI001D0F7557|nr:VOC family protein [Hymenobacter sp. BT770]MCC3155496.1 VOC family protein [Hymenobacter sp. BT770]MDO3417503.1 VOC family protein [Hymenobacter sp. BT770]